MTPRIWLNGVFVLSACITLLQGPYMLSWVRSSQLSPIFIFLGPTVFTAIFFLFALDLIFLKKHLEQSKKARIFPLLFGAILIIFILPRSMREYKVQKSSTTSTQIFLESLAKNKDARIRALVMLAADRKEMTTSAWSLLMLEGLKDNDPFVRRTTLKIVSKQFGIAINFSKNGLIEAQRMIHNWNDAY